MMNKIAQNVGAFCRFLKNPKNVEYLNFLNENLNEELLDLPLAEKIYYFYNNIEFPLFCKCGNNLSFIGFKNGYRKTCGNEKCLIESRKETCLEKYGVDNPKKSKDIILKEKENIKKKWGVDHYMLSDKVKDKFKTTMIDKHGVEWAQQSKIISDKSSKTFENNPDRENIIKTRTESLLNKSEDEKNEINDKKRKTLTDNFGSVDNFYDYLSNKIKESSIDKFGIEHHLSHPDIIEKRIKSYKLNIENKLKSKLPIDIQYIDRKSNSNNTDSIIILKHIKCDSQFKINRQYLEFRLSSNDEICLICNPRLSGKSNMELDLLEFIKENYKETILSNSKSIIENNELDIYIPELKLAFEFNGLYWHSELYKDRKYHLNKTKKCEEVGVQLIHIWEDDWEFKKDIVKSIILNKIGKSQKIYARKCDIKEITDNKLVRDFLIKNHIQGFVGSKIKLGLFLNNELVSLMTFGNLRKSLGQKSIDGSYELLRFCNKLNTSVVGGASKLFKYFINNYPVKQVISYSDNSRGVGNLYKNLGFEFIHESDPNYYYIINGIKQHRFNFRKDKLISEGYDPNKTEVEIMHDRNYFRIFDCGSKKWIFENPN